jgi:heterotetrameric sarcosine oxidase gamma subunit
VTDTALAVRLEVRITPPDGLFLLEAWGDGAAVSQRIAARWAALPTPCGAVSAGAGRLLWWEPAVWLLRTGLEDRPAALAHLTDALADYGAVTEVSGGFRRLRVSGVGWRELLMIGGVFDAEAPRFGPGCVAGTVIHHLPVRLDVVDALTVDAYTPSSYSADLLHHWTVSAARLNAGR